MDLLTGLVLMVAFFVAAIVLIYLAVRSKRELERKRVDCTEAASGTVEKVRRISVSGESCNYYPTFAFFDGNHIVQEESKIGYARDMGVAYINRYRICGHKCIWSRNMLFCSKILNKEAILMR